MYRRSLWLSLALVALIVSTVLTTLVLLTQHVPAFYLRSEVPPTPQRLDVSVGFFRRASNLVDSIKSQGNRDTANGWDWGEHFSEEEVNSFFKETFLTWKVDDKLLPPGVSDPRVAFDKDRIRLGFRYGSSRFSTIIAIDFRVWLAKDKPNVVVLELGGVHAGSLPISAQSLLENISETLQRNNIQVSWYRHKGNPTAALKFMTDQAESPWQLLRLDLNPGMMTIAGHSNSLAN
jgi:hypothetical protein